MLLLLLLMLLLMMMMMMMMLLLLLLMMMILLLLLLFRLHLHLHLFFPWWDDVGGHGGATEVRMLVLRLVAVHQVCCERRVFEYVQAVV